MSEKNVKKEGRSYFRSPQKKTSATPTPLFLIKRSGTPPLLTILGVALRSASLEHIESITYLHLHSTSSNTRHPPLRVQFPKSKLGLQFAPWAGMSGCCAQSEKIKHFHSKYQKKKTTRALPPPQFQVFDGHFYLIFSRKRQCSVMTIEGEQLVFFGSS